MKGQVSQGVIDEVEFHEKRIKQEAQQIIDERDYYKTKIETLIEILEEDKKDSLILFKRDELTEFGKAHLDYVSYLLNLIKE